MLRVPPRDRLAALFDAVNHVVPAPVAGLAQRVDDSRVSVLICHANGVSQLLLPNDEVVETFVPERDGTHQQDTSFASDESKMALAWMLALGRVQRIASVRAPSGGPSTRLWIGLTDPAPVTDAQLAQLVSVAEANARPPIASGSGADADERHERMERASKLLPALLHVLDIREVFDRVSSIAREALPHDRLLLRLFSDDLTKMSVFARSDGGQDPSPMLPHPFPPATVRGLEFRLIDDMSKVPPEADTVPRDLGARSGLRMAIRFDDRVIGMLGFVSVESRQYTIADVEVGRRLADYVAVGLSHYRLAEDGRRAAALRERTANLEMLDGLLDTLAGVLDVSQVFDRVSAIAQKVLPHDGMSIAEAVGDGKRVRILASHGLGSLSEALEIAAPDPWMVNEPWDFRIIDDAYTLPQYTESPGRKAGMRSMLFSSIRFEGKFFGGLNFYSRTPGHYVKDDVLVARRITDHVALALSHRRLAEQERLHEELRARTTNLELLDELLTALIDSGELAGVFDRLTGIAKKVLPHDASVLMVRLPDGQHARVYASAGFPGSMPRVTEIPHELVENPDWEHDIFDDLPDLHEPNYMRLADMGFRSLLRVPVLLDNKFAGALVFVSKARAAFKHSDVLVARRIADRATVTIARERESQASKRADEATARASQLEARVRALTDELDARTGYRRVLGESQQWREVLKQATQVAATETTVLLLGESGTGKEVVARFLHRASVRNHGPFIALNCAALPEHLLEAELFGYERGAFTGATQSKPGQLEQAAGGTLFLDEVGEMSPAAQAKFLRVLQEREFQRLGGTRVLRTDARIVAATNRDLQKAIANGQFREDLFYRLNVFAIRLPALRDRRDDVLPLSEAFLKEIGRGLGRPPAGISRDARQLLLDYHWPGNVRELRNILERAAILCDGGLVAAEHLAISTMPAAAPAPAVRPDVLPSPEAPRAAAATAPAGDLQTVERAMIEQALQSARFNRSKAAKALGLTRHQLYLRMRKYGFD
jgi:transcriptional regulator with GAF, ATPase, and Fis domain